MFVVGSSCVISLVMEEAAQVLEVETLIPMLLQNTEAVDGSRLKRVVLIGDHFQLHSISKTFLIKLDTRAHNCNTNEYSLSHYYETPIEILMYRTC